MDIKTVELLSGTLVMLILCSIGVFFLRRSKNPNLDPAIVETIRARVRAWWLLFCPLVGAFFLGSTATIVLFAMISILAFREYISVVPTRLADHRSLFWVYLVCIPLQFTLVGLEPDWFRGLFGLSPYLVFSILIPAYVFLLVPAWIATSDDSKRFLERIAKIQVGLLICVYCLSFAPALLTMEVPDRDTDKSSSTPIVSMRVDPAVETTVEAAMDMARNVVGDTTTSPVSSETGRAGAVREPVPWKLQLLLFFVLIVQIGDILQYAGSQLSRQAVVAPAINSTRTWTGMLGGAAATALVGGALWYFTPFPKWWQCGLIAFTVSLMGFAGSMTMSAIKRDRGVEDYGTLIEGHGGILDRLDSLCFAAPLFYHLSWLFLNFDV